MNTSMNKFLIAVLFLFFYSCQEKPSSKPNTFKIGKFKTELDEDATVSFAERNDSIQIETFNSKKDTFRIKWLSNFEYVLVKKNPLTLLDSTPFHVKIISVKERSYQFKAYYKGSNFKQKGTAYKIE